MGHLTAPIDPPPRFLRYGLVCRARSMNRPETGQKHTYRLYKALTPSLTPTAAAPPRRWQSHRPAAAVIDLNLTLGKLYRQRGENDKAINMHRALLDSPDTVSEKRARVLLNWRKTTKCGLGGPCRTNLPQFAGRAIWHASPPTPQSIYQQDRDWEKRHRDGTALKP